jgi:GxxExxY protein
MIRQTHQMTPTKMVSDFIFKDECYAIIGACFEVYKDKACGFYEPVYQECLAIAFEYSRIPAIAQPALSLEYDPTGNRMKRSPCELLASFGVFRG